MSKAARRREVERQLRLMIRQEKILERDLRRHFAAMGNALAAAGGALGIVDSYRPKLAAILQRHLRRTALIFGGRMLDAAASKLKGADGPRSGLLRTLHGSRLTTKGMREIFDGVILKWVRGYALDRAKTISETLKKQVRIVLRDAVRSGEGEAGTAKAIRERVGRQLSASNAARIARTETHTASSIGSDEAARSTELEMEKEWAAAGDARTRPSHSAADGQTVEMEESFDVGGEALAFPGDPSASAQEIVNCRCVVLYHPRIGGELFR